MGASSRVRGQEEKITFSAGNYVSFKREDPYADYSNRFCFKTVKSTEIYNSVQIKR
jgi:hypothetical protein